MGLPDCKRPLRPCIFVASLIPTLCQRISCPFFFSYPCALTNALTLAKQQAQPFVFCCLWQIDGNHCVLSYFSVFLDSDLSCDRDINLRGEEAILTSCFLSPELLFSRKKANHVHYLKQFWDLSTGYWPIIKWTLLKTSGWIFSCCCGAKGETLTQPVLKHKLL